MIFPKLTKLLKILKNKFNNINTHTNKYNTDDNDKPSTNSQDDIYYK